MTTSVITSHITNHGFNSDKNSFMFSENIYQVEINGEDGDYITLEIMAQSCSQAAAKAEGIAAACMIDIAYINVTTIG